MQLRWLGTAGFELSSGGATVLIDPYFTRNPKARPEQRLKPADFPHVQAVFLTHGHFDHSFDVPAVVELSGAAVFASPVVCQSLASKGVPWNRLRPCWGGESVEVGPFRFTAVPARHVTFDAHLVLSTAWKCLPHLPELARLGSTHYPCGQVLGWYIEVESKRLFHMGSACLPRDLDEKVDVFMVPVQGRTDICSVAADLVARIKPSVVIPHHHDDFYPPLSRYVDLGPFEHELRLRGLQVQVRTPALNRLMEL
ncbi:MAG: MBL fold metallo-hydrolase [Actinobacteria bacterium]|jgi:L-ascorbate metabolism protein UlaG (beta-lactamase superfamily)|nr:MAG: MBL fold metallo-hydrolase [Actinomycetota bacterium]